MTDALLILKKLAMLREHAARVRRRRPVTREAFEADIDLQDALALSFLVSVQEANDIALHLSAAEDALDRYVQAIARLATDDAES